MSDVSLFLDESGSDNLRDVYYILALVVHDQANNLDEDIHKYQASLRQKGLPDIPFHGTPLLNGHDDYKDMDLATRKRLLSTFRVFFRHLPIRYGWIVLKTREHETPDDVSAAMRRQIRAFLNDHLVYFQQFDQVKVYYDHGQQSIETALHEAIGSTISKNAFTFRPSTPADYRLSQAADYICTMELAALKYQDKKPTATDEKFFGSWRMFKKGILKEVRAKQF